MPAASPFATRRSSLSARLCLGLLLAIVLLGGALRFYAVDFGLPDQYARPDERILISRSIGFGTGDLNPHYFRYPTLFMYMLFSLYEIYYLLGLFFGWFKDAADFRLAYSLNPYPFYIIARGTSALLGTLSLVLIYLLGRKLYSKEVGLLGALFGSLTFLHIRDSHFGVTDVPATFFTLLAFLFIAHLLRHDGWPRYGLAGAAAGIATSFKYNMGLLVVPLVCAHLLRCAPRVPRIPRCLADRKVALALAAMAGAYLLGSPYTLLDFSQFKADFMAEVAHFRSGHGIDLGPGWLHHLRFSLRYGMGLPCLIASFAGITIAVMRRRKEDLLLLAFPVFYYGAIGSGKAVFVRYAIPLLPFMVLFSALFFTAFLDTLRLSGVKRVSAILLGSTLILVPSLRSTVGFLRILSQPGTRVEAARWIEAHLTSHTVILVDSLLGLPIREDKRMLQDKLALLETQMAGSERIREKYLLLLAKPGYPPEPSYYVYRFRESRGDRATEGAQIILESMRGDDTTDMSLRVSEVGDLKGKAVEFVVTEEHFLALYSRVSPQLEGFLKGSYELVKTFSPFGEDDWRQLQPVFDPIDAFYIPMDNFDGILKAGPLIKVYSLKKADAGEKLDGETL